MPKFDPGRGPQVLAEHVFSPGALRTHRPVPSESRKASRSGGNPVALLQSVNFISRFHHFPEKFMSQVFSGNARGRRREAFRVHFHEHEMDVGAAKPAGQVLHLEPAGDWEFPVPAPRRSASVKRAEAPPAGTAGCGLNHDNPRKTVVEVKRLHVYFILSVF